MLVRGLKLGHRSLAMAKSFSSSTSCCANKEDKDLKLDHPFAVYDEFRVFEALLSNRFHSRDDLPYLAHIKKLRQVEEQRKQYKASSNIRRIQGILSKREKRDSTKQTQQFEQLDKVKTILQNNKALTANDIDNFLQIGSSDLTIQSSVISWIIQALNAFIEEGGPRSLPAVADLLTTYFTLGFEGHDIGQVDAQKLVNKVLSRALELYPETVYTIQNQEVVPEYGVPVESVDAFRYFVDGYIDSYDVHEVDGTELYDMLFRLASKSGSIDIADVLLDVLMQKDLPSAQSIEAFIRALTNLINAQRLVFVGNDLEFTSKMKHELMQYRQLLISEQVTPVVVEFLLLWTSNLDEVYSILETATKSKFRNDIFSQCQISILNTVVKCGLGNGYSTAMAHMFGVLNRFSENSDFGITAAAYDQCLLLSAIYGNSSGMYRSISMKMGLQGEADTGTNVSTAIPLDIAAQVFDRLPTIDGDLAKEKQVSVKDSWWMGNSLIHGEYSMDQAVLSHLRSQIDPLENHSEYQRYLGALGRFGMPARLTEEWQKLVQSTPITNLSQDVILAFLGAYKTASSSSSSSGIDMLKQVLESGNNGQAISILKRVFRYEVLPLKVAVPFVANWIIKNKSTITWTSQDIEQTFEEVAGPNSITSLTPDEARAASMIGRAVAEAVIQVQGGKDVDESISNLSDLLCRS